MISTTGNIESSSKRVRFLCILFNFSANRSSNITCFSPPGLHNTHRWRVANVCVDYKSSVVSSLNLSVPTPTLDRLQRLKVKFQLSYDNLRRLQGFPKLVQLEVGLLEIGPTAECVRLSALRTLYVENVNHEERGFLLIDSPVIKNVSFGANAIDSVKFTDYSTVQTLEFYRDRYGSCLAYTNLRLAVSRL